MTKLVLNKSRLPKRQISEYNKLAPKLYRQILRAAKKCRDLCVIHINATPEGGGVAEMLKSQIPLERSLGLDSRWLVITKAPKSFFKVTKKIHNCLQGDPALLNQSERKIYLKVSKDLAGFLSTYLEAIHKPVMLVVHDPQVLALPHFMTVKADCLLRLHMDLSRPNKSVLNFLLSYVEPYKKIIVSAPMYKAALPAKLLTKTSVIMPAIDPFSKKNIALPRTSAKAILKKFHIPADAPLAVQVSRFDRWKDPLGVIQAYQTARKNLPGLQLVLAGLAVAKDDPEADEILRQVKSKVNGDSGVHIFFNPRDISGIPNDKFINALLTSADVVLQKSTKEGFGLTMTEAMWKAKPVVAGKTAGALLQIKDKQNGLIVSSNAEASRDIVNLLLNKGWAKKLGSRAKKSVYERFLMPRLVYEHLNLYR